MDTIIDVLIVIALILIIISLAIDIIKKLKNKKNDIYTIKVSRNEIYNKSI
mgnify:CR=1 FL=1